MKDKNISLARKILLALLAVLMAVGAFLGVATLKRGGLVGSVEGALTASADEGTPQKPTAEQLAAYKTAALDQLAKAYEGITGNAVTIGADGNVTSTVPDKVSADDLGKLGEAVKGINKAVGLTGANQHDGINEFVRDTIENVLKAAYSTADSAKVRAYMWHTADPETESDKGGIKEQFEALYDYGPNANKGPIYIQVLDVADLVKDVHTTLDTMRTAEKTKATDLYKKVYDFYGFSAEEYEVPAALSGAKNCSEVNDALEKAFAALLTSADKTLGEHYTTLNGDIVGAINEADTEATRDVPTEKAIFTDIVLAAENDRLAESKEAAATALTGYLETLGAEGIELDDLTGITLEGDDATVPAALAEVNKALKDAVKSALDSLLQKDAEGNVIDTEGVVGTIGGFKDAVDAVDTVDAYTGLSDLSETLSGVTTAIDNIRKGYLEDAQKVYAAFNEALTGTNDASEGELKALESNEEKKYNIFEINKALKADAKALAEKQYAKEGETSLDSAAVAGAIEDLANAIDALPAAETDTVVLSFGQSITSLITALKDAKKAEQDAITAAYKKVYTEAFGNEDWDDATSVPEGITNATNTAALNTALTAAVNVLFNGLASEGDSTELTKAIADAKDAITKLATGANATEGHPTLLTSEGLLTEVNAQLAKIALQKEVDEAKANLDTFANQVKDACQDQSAVDWDKELTTAKGIIQAAKAGEVDAKLEEAKDALRTAAKNEIAKKQYADSYKAIYGTDIDSLDAFAALLTAEGANANDVLYNAIVGTDGLIEKAVAALKTAVAANDTRCLDALATKLKADVDGVTADEGVYKQVYNYAEALDGAKAALDFAKSQDEAIKSVAEKLAGLNTSLKARIAEADWAALSDLADSYKAEIAALTDGGDVTPAAKATTANNDLNAKALQYVAKQEYIESIKAVTGNDPSADLLNKFVDDISELTTVEGLNGQLETSVSNDIKALYADDSAAVNAKVQYCLDKIQGNTADVIEDVSAVFADADEATGDQALSSEISSIKGKEKEAATQDYKNVYEAINGTVEDWGDKYVPLSIRNATTCKELVGALKAAIDELLVGTDDTVGGLLAAHADDSAAVKKLITDAKDDIDGKCTEQINAAATARQLPEGIPEDVTTLLSDIENSVTGEKTAAENAYKKFYNAVMGKAATDPDLTDLKAALDKAQDCTGFNAALQDAMKKLVKTFADAQAATAEEESTVLTAVVTTLNGDIDKAFTELTAVLTETVAETLGGEVKALVNFELARIAAVKKVNTAYDAATKLYAETALSEGGKAALTRRKAAADGKLGTLEGPGSIAVTKGEGTWDDAYTAAETELNKVIDDLKIETKNEAEFDVFAQIVTNAVAEQLYIESYKTIMHAESVPEADTFKKDNLDDSDKAYEKAKSVTTLNTTLKTALNTLLDNIANGQTTATAAKIAEQKTTINNVAYEDSDIGNFPKAATDAMGVIDPLITADVNAIKDVYTAAYGVVKGGEPTDLADFDTARSCAKATETLSTKLSTLIQGLELTTDSEKVKTFIGNFDTAVKNYISTNGTTRLEGFAETVKFTITGGSKTEYTLADAVAEIAALRNGAITDAVDEYLAAYKAATGDDTATEATEAVATFKAGLIGKNTEEVNTALKNAVNALLDGLLLEGDSKEVNDVIKDAKGLVSAAVAGANGISSVATYVTTAKSDVDSKRTSELNAAKAEYAEVYTQLTGGAPTDTETVFGDTLKTAADFDGALKTAIKAALNGYDETKDAQEIKDYLEKDATAAIDAVDPNDETGISDLTDAVQGIIDAVAAKRAAEKVAAIKAYIAVYNIINNVTLYVADDGTVVTTDPHPAAGAAIAAADLQALANAVNADFVATINALTYAKDMNDALKTAVTSLVNGYVTEGDSKDAAGEAKKLDLTAAPAENGISDFTDAVTTVKTAIDGQRDAERDNAKASYVAVYNALMGTNVAATDDAVKAAVAEFDAEDLVDAQAFNNKLKSLIENLYNNSIQGKDSKTVDDYVKSLYDAIVGAIDTANGTGNTDRVGVNFTGTTEFTVGEETVTLAAAGTETSGMRTAEKEDAVAAYEEAYKAINGAAYDEAKATDAEKAAHAAVAAGQNAKALNDALKTGVKALVNGLLNTTDSAAVEKIVADVVKAIEDLGTDTEGNLVAIDTDALTAALTVGAEKTLVKAAVEAKRAEEIAAIQAAYVKAYNILSGYTATVTADGITVKNGEALADKVVVDAFTEAYNALAKSATVYDFGTALKVLSEKVVALVDALATDEDSKAINDYVTAAATAVKNGIEASAVAPNFGSVKFTVKGEEKTLADIKTAVADMRTTEKDKAVAAYKAAYEAVKGAAYDDAKATDAEKATLSALNDAKNATGLNAALKEGVTALVNSLKDDAKDSKAVKDIVAGVVKAIDALGTDADKNLVAIDTTALTAAMQVGETDKVAVKEAVEKQREADVQDVKDLYLETYNLLTGENVTDPADEKVSAALEAIAEAENFVDAYDALSEQFDALVDSLRSDADSANVTALIDAIGKALTDAIAGAKDSREQVVLSTVVVDYDGSELPLATAIEALDAMREKEFLEAKKAYVDAYNLVHGTQWALDEKTHELPEGADAALTTALVGLQGEGDTLTDVNNNLVAAVQALISEYFDETIHTGEVKSYLQDPAGTFGDGENNAKAVIAASSKLGNGLNDVVGAVEAAIARVEQFRVDEVALVVAEYLEAYKALVNDAATEASDAVKAFQDKVKDMQTGEANAALIEGVQALLENCLNKDEEDNYAGESQAMKDLLDAQQGLIGEVAPSETTGVSDLTGAVADAKEAFKAKRRKEMRDALNAYLEAYEILTKTTPDNSITARFNDVLGSDRHTMADLIGLLGEQIGLIIEKDVKLDGDSDSVKEFLNGLKDAVETHFTTNEVPKLAIPDVSEIKIAYQGNNTLAENRAKLDERRAEERNAGKNLYKGYYEVIKGEAYQDRYATEAEKKFITDLDAAKNNAEVNEIVFNAVKALIDGWYLTDADGENVKKVATDLENALHDKFNADSALGVLAEDYEADITAILVAIDLRREQDTTIGEVNAAYDAIETDRLEAAAKGELDAAKADALAAIEEVTLGEGTVADAADALDAILVSAIDALNRKAAEGIAKQEYLDSYKNITGEDAADTDDVFTAITDAAALSTYTDAVNATLQSAVNALLDNVLVRDSKNVLKDSQATKMIVEAAKKAVWTLMQDATKVPDVSEAVKNVKTDVDAQRAAEKETANSAIDAAVEGKTYSDAVKAVLDLAALTAAAKAKVESGNYADVAAAVAQLKGQVALLNYVAALEGKVGFAEALEAAKAAAATIGETATEAEAEKAAARGLLDTQKAYAKACLKDLVKNESDSIKDSVLVEYNAKIDMAKSAEDVEALYAEAKLAVSAGRFLDSYSVLRKSFAGIGAGDKAALEAALLAFTNLDAASDAKVYLNGKTRYTSYEDEIQDMIAKADFEAAKAEAVSGVKTLAAGKTGSYFQKVANSQISKINAITYQPHKNAADRSAYLQELKDAVEKVLNETSGKLESAQPVQNAEDKMNAVLDEYLASGNYQGNTKDNLQNILDTYFDRAEEEGVTEAQLDAIVEEAKAALDAANVSTVGSSVALDNGEYAENYKGSALYGTVTTDSNNGLAKSTTVSIEKKDGSLTKAAIKDAANSGKLKAAAGTTLTEDEMKALVDGKDVITTLDISLSATAEGGLYTVKVLLPEDLRNVENIAIVYATADGGVEVFDAHVSEDGYLTFTTDHFSEFVVLGEGSVNLWWLVITLTVVLALELVALLVVLLKKNKKSSTTAASVLPLGLLALVIPMNATGICIVLGVCVVGLGVGIFFAARHKKKANQK